MGKNRFVKLETVRLELSDGDWIEVKKELTYGEQLDLQELSTTRDETDQFHLNMSDFMINRILARVVAWSLEDDNGPVEITRDSIRALSGPASDEINKALDARFAREASKN